MDLSPVHPTAIDLRAECCSKLRHANLGNAAAGITSVGSFLQLSSPALVRILDPLLTFHECEELKRRICMCCATQPTSALSLFLATTEVVDTGLTLNPIRHVSTGLASLDRCLRGGFRVGTISEIVGRAGTGKTQLAMQLCVVAARFNQGTVFIDTEKKLSLRRLHEIAQARVVVHKAEFQHEIDMDIEDDFMYDGGVGDVAIESEQALADTKNTYKTAAQVMENTTVHSPGSTDELISVVSGIEEEILLRNQEAEESESKFPVRLIILDSIAAPARRDFGSESAPQRVATLMQVAQTLKRLADQLQCAVVVINQVGLLESGGGERSERNAGSSSDYVAVRAALGTSWHHCLSTRLLMEHELDPHRLNNSTTDEAPECTIPGRGNVSGKSTRGHIRRATVVKSNVAGWSNTNYIISDMGLVEIGNTESGG